VLGAAVGNHALERVVGANDLHQLVGEVVLAPEASPGRQYHIYRPGCCGLQKFGPMV
jgi:hypothetical protein